MPNYIRSRVEGGTYFFTVVSYQRMPILIRDTSRILLHEAFEKTSQRYPFETVAYCLLPDHLHCIWKLPEGDSNYSMRWNVIKGNFTNAYMREIGSNQERSDSRQKRREATIWQRRFWEHTITDEIDLEFHLDYIHYNPIKHGYVTRATDWQWSSFHRFVEDGVYDNDWVGGDEGRLKMLDWERFSFGD